MDLGMRNRNAHARLLGLLYLVLLATGSLVLASGQQTGLDGVAAPVAIATAAF